LGIGDWAQSPIPNPQSPIPNPHTDLFYFLNFNNRNHLIIIFYFLISNKIKMSQTDDKTKAKSTSSLQLISKEKQFDENDNITLEVTNEGMDYLNQMNSNYIGIISIIGPEKSSKSYFSNLIIGDKEAFDITKSTIGIHMCGLPIAHGDNTDLIVLDTEGLYKESNSKTSYDKQTFILSSLLSSIMIYSTDESISDCITKFTNLAKESLSSIKKAEGKELTTSELPLVYFIFHNSSIDSATANQQFRNLVKNNPIFTNFFQNFKICVLKKEGDRGRENSLAKAKTSIGRLEDMGSLDDQDYKQKSKSIKDQIINDLEPKRINNCNLDGKCLFGVIQSFVDSLNKGDNILLFNQFNNVLVLCLSEVVDQINFNFTSDKLNKKMADNTSIEETFLDICKVTFNELLDEQYDKFKSMPIVKISPSPNIFTGIKSIFKKILETLCENIQSFVDEKSNIINQTSKIEFTNKLEQYNIEKLLNGYTCFIYEKILSPLYEPNNKKLQNNDKIVQILKSKICGTIEKISPLIQGRVNELIEQNSNLKKDLEKHKNDHLKEMQQKNDEISDLKLKIEKRDRDIREKELENMTLINIEKEKYNQLEEKYNKEISDKNARIKELIKNSNTLPITQSTTSGAGGPGVQQIQFEALKNDYNHITNILVNYKILVNKLVNDKEFFFQDLLIDKTLVDLRKKYPEIFNLLSEKESLENMKTYYDKQIDVLRNENFSLKEKSANLLNEIEELKFKLDEANKKVEDRQRLYEAKVSNMQSLQTTYDTLERKINEKDILIKLRDKQITESDNKIKEKDNEISRKENIFMKEVAGLTDIIESMFSKDKSKFDNAYFKLSTNTQNNLLAFGKSYKFKWS